mmetsp:Transcript_111110/g.346257  ORF Transcript_111110/g.346257 Transcript_111110/m.346257 type:complete len:269 (-) Transcript_111110:17-823(-)
MDRRGGLATCRLGVQQHLGAPRRRDVLAARLQQSRVERGGERHEQRVRQGAQVPVLPHAGRAARGQLGLEPAGGDRHAQPRAVGHPAVLHAGRELHGGGQVHGVAKQVRRHGAVLRAEGLRERARPVLRASRGPPPPLGPALPGLRLRVDRAEEGAVGWQADLRGKGDITRWACLGCGRDRRSAADHRRGRVGPQPGRRAGQHRRERRRPSSPQRSPTPRRLGPRGAHGRLRIERHGRAAVSGSGQRATLPALCGHSAPRAAAQSLEC